MTLHSFALYLSNRIQEAQKITIEKLSEKTNRSPATIRRTIHILNEYLEEEKHFIVTESKIINQLTYTEYIQFIQQLTLFDYATIWNERLCFYSVFQWLMVMSISQNSMNYWKLVNPLRKKTDKIFFKNCKNSS